MRDLNDDKRGKVVAALGKLVKDASAEFDKARDKARARCWARRRMTRRRKTCLAKTPISHRGSRAQFRPDPERRAQGQRSHHRSRGAPARCDGVGSTAAGIARDALRERGLASQICC
jgi:hypothetical protein